MEKRISLEERRLRAIKSKYAFFSKECECCKDKVRFEKMWKVRLWGMNRRINTKYFCHKCTPTARAVYNQIDSKIRPPRIVGVDDY